MRRYKKSTVLIMIIILLISATACSQNEQFISCKNCNAEVSPDNRFCSNCGSSIAENFTSATTSEESSSLETSSSTDVAEPSIAEGSTKETQATTETTHNTQVPSTPPPHAHSFTPANCTEPQTCSCGATNGTSLGHSWENATCTAPKRCTRCGITNGNALGHSYSAKITAPTCTEQGYTSYTCTCGDSYLSDYVEPSHNYIDYVCSMCGKADEHYSAYQSEFAILTKEYNSNVSELESKIVECNENIVSAQNELNNATIELAALSPTCPPGYIQDFVSKNWKEYGSTSVATEIAKETWKREYDFKSKKLNEKISAKKAEIQINQANIELYKSQISNLTTTYSSDVQLLKSKYGVS